MVRKKRKAGGGRKKLPPDRSRSAMLTARVYPDLKADLDRACERSGKTLSDEIEERIRRSFSKREDAFGDNTTRYFALLVARLASRLQEETGVSWRDDRWTFDALSAGIPALLSRMVPKGEPKMSAQLAEHLAFWEREGMEPVATLFRTPPAFGAYMAFQLIELAAGDMKEWAEASKRSYDLPRAGREVRLTTDGDES